MAITEDHSGPAVWITPTDGERSTGTSLQFRETLVTLIPGCAVTLEQDRAEIERVAVSWQDVPELEQEAMLASLGKMLEYLDSSEDAEYQLRLDAERLMTKIEAGLGR